MKPGKELDELIAKRIMGWKHTPWTGWESPDGEYRGQPEPPPYSTDLLSAKQVTEQLERRGISLDIEEENVSDIPRVICEEALKAMDVEIYGRAPQNDGLEPMKELHKIQKDKLKE